MEKKKKGKFTFGKLKLLILLVVLVYMGVTYVSQQSVLAEQHRRQSELQQQKEELEREIEFKKNELDYIGTNDYVEQQAHERLGWLKDDEIKYVEGSAGTPPGAVQSPPGTVEDAQQAPDEQAIGAEPQATTPPSDEPQGSGEE